jgi:hypothetical protein
VAQPSFGKEGEVKEDGSENAADDEEGLQIGRANVGDVSTANVQLGGYGLE